MCISILQFPVTEEDWTRIAEEFEVKWQYVNCLGAADGKHVAITAPPGSGSFYYNYKGFHSLVLLAVVDANCDFIMCDFGTNGRISDGGVLDNTRFGQKLHEGTLRLPRPRTISPTMQPLPYTFVGDEAFALGINFLKPFNQKELFTNERKVFNYRLSRARRVAENAFGILTSKFRIFHTPINLKLENTEVVVLACCVLHNYLRRLHSTTNAARATMLGEPDFDGTQSLPLVGLQNGTTVPNVQAKVVRDMYVEYFTGEGAVPWQDEMI